MEQLYNSLLVSRITLLPLPSLIRDPFSGVVRTLDSHCKRWHRSSSRFPHHSYTIYPFHALQQMQDEALKHVGFYSYALALQSGTVEPETSHTNVSYILVPWSSSDHDTI